jgi:hypothetical protein
MLMHIDIKLKSYMFLVKCYCRIKIGVDDYIVVDLCVIKSSPIIVWMTMDYVS